MDLLYEVKKMVSEAGGCQNLAAEIILENGEYYSESEIKDAMLILSQETIKRILFTKDTALNRIKNPGSHYTWTHRELVFLKDNWDILPLTELSKRLKKPEKTVSNTARLFFKKKHAVINFYRKYHKTA